MELSRPTRMLRIFSIRILSQRLEQVGLFSLAEWRQRKNTVVLYKNIGEASMSMGVVLAKCGDHCWHKNSCLSKIRPKVERS